jgi:hypothetical protein
VCRIAFYGSVAGWLRPLGPLALSYFTNSCYVRSETSKIFTFDHPYIIDGANTRWWLHWGWAFHVGAIVWGVLSLVAFVVGMIDVRNAIVRLAS